MKLVILHYHFRPGGVRRVIELATPALVAHWPTAVRRVVLATGEAPDAPWLAHFRALLPSTLVDVLVEPAFGYTSETGTGGPELQRQVAAGLRRFVRTRDDDVLVWAHNLGLGRNLELARQLRPDGAHRTKWVLHHHDWWFDNRWSHFAAWPGAGASKLAAVAEAVFGGTPGACQVAINQADATVLGRHFPGQSGWLPNPVSVAAPPSATRVAAAREWLRERCGDAGPVWLSPCRLLRRKNLAEALLLTRWLRPEAWLVTTGGPSSAEEQAYAEALRAAAEDGGWRLRLGVLHGDESQSPTVPELLAASEAILLTSLQEGFGLPVLEAAAAGRPLLARRWPNLAPDLARFGFRFPQSYREILLDPGLFDWPRERARQAQRFAAWQELMPESVRRWVGEPALLAADGPRPVPFSRLTLAAQLEVLRHPPATSQARCAPLNPWLERWQKRAATGRLRVSPWPASAARWLGGRAYARRFQALLSKAGARQSEPVAALAVQQQFLRQKLRAENLYPLLWNSEP